LTWLGLSIAEQTKQIKTTIRVETAPRALIQATSFMDLTRTNGIATRAQEIIVHGTTPISPAVPTQSYFQKNKK
jgi:hypothetical protein